MSRTMARSSPKCLSCDQGAIKGTIRDACICSKVPTTTRSSVTAEAELGGCRAPMLGYTD
jgi:hypothetical protein